MSSEALVLFNPRGQMPGDALNNFVRHEERLKNHVLFQSSGSTGLPKWIALSHAALEASALACNAHLQSTAKDVFGLALPRFHVGGFGLMERARVAGANFKEFSGIWNAERFVDWLKENKVSIISLVPAQVYDLVKHNLNAPDWLRAAWVGGGELLPALYSAAREKKWPLLPSYGLSECASQVASAELTSLNKSGFPSAKLLSHIDAEQISPGRARIKSSALLSFYVQESARGFGLEDPKQNDSFLLPDHVELDGKFLKVFGRMEEDYKILGEWIRWDFLKKKFHEISYRYQQFLRVEIGLFQDDRRGNLIAFLCEEFDQSAKLLVNEFNREVFPFERITHYYEGILPRSGLGKILANKIKDISLKEISV